MKERGRNILLKPKPQTNRNYEPRFKADEEPTNKKAYVTMKSMHYIWNGNDWELLSLRYGDVADSNITMEIVKWMKTDEYKKLVDKKK